MPDNGNQPLGQRTNRRQVLKYGGVAAVSALAGCTGGGDGNGDSGGEVTGNGDRDGNNNRRNFHVLMSGASPDEQNQFTAVFESWVEDRGLNVELSLEFIEFDAYPDKINTQFAAGNAADLLWGDIAETLFHHESLAGVGDVVPDTVPESARYVIQGREMTAPVSGQHVVPWHRTDVYEEAGLEFGTTWDHHLQNMEELQDHVEERVFTEYVNVNASSNYTSYSQDAGLMQADTDYLARDSMAELPYVILDQEPYRSRAIEYFEYLGELYQYSPDTSSGTYGDSISTYVAERTTTIRYAARVLQNIYDQEPELADVTAPTKYAASPAVQDGKDPVHTGGIGGFAVPKDEAGGSVDLAKNFIEYLYESDALVDLLLAVPLHMVPADLSMWDNPKFQENDIVRNHQEYIDLTEELWEHQISYTDRTTHLEGSAPTIEWGTLVRGSNIAHELYANAVTGRRDPGEAIDNTAEKLRQSIDELDILRIE